MAMRKSRWRTISSASRNCKTNVTIQFVLATCSCSRSTVRSMKPPGHRGSGSIRQLDALPADVDFVCIVLHHPTFYRFVPTICLSGGHSARNPEQVLPGCWRIVSLTLMRVLWSFAGHVHNYERHEHGGVIYFVTGGGGAHPYLIPRKPGDPLFGKPVNYHYLLVEVDHGKMKITMNRVEMDKRQGQLDHARCR